MSFRVLVGVKRVIDFAVKVSYMHLIVETMYLLSLVYDLLNTVQYACTHQYVHVLKYNLYMHGN